MTKYFDSGWSAEIVSSVSAPPGRKGLKGAMVMAVMVGSLAVVACGANGTAESTEKTDSASEGLHELACTTVTPDVTTTATGYSNPNVNTRYGSTSCPTQYVVRMNSFTPGRAIGVSAKVAPATTISQADCPNTEASIDLYSSNDGTNWTIAGSASSYGTWFAGFPPLEAPNCYYGQGVGSNAPGLTEQTGLYADYIVVGSILQHPANRSQAYDSQFPMAIQIGGIYPP